MEILCSPAALRHAKGDIVLPSAALSDALNHLSPLFSSLFIHKFHFPFIAEEDEVTWMPFSMQNHPWPCLGASAGIMPAEIRFICWPMTHEESIRPSNLIFLIFCAAFIEDYSLLLSARCCLSWSSTAQPSYKVRHSWSCSRVQKPIKVDLLKTKHLK